MTLGYIVSGGIGINITRNQDTAVPFPYNSAGVGKRHCRVLVCHSGAAGIDLILISMLPDLI